MKKRILVIAVGDRRIKTETLSPGTYDLCKDGKYVELRCACLIDVEYVFSREHPENKGEYWLTIDPAEWRRAGYLHDTLRVKPSWWRRVTAFVFRKPLIPRAVTVIDRK